MKKIDPKYLPVNMPPVKNWPFYLYRCFIKVLATIIFGLGSGLLTVLVLPLFNLFIHDKEKLRKVGHRFVSALHNGFVHSLKFLQVLDYKIDDLEKLRSLKSCVIVANHPSLIDVVMIFSFVRNADCIVKAGLAKGPMSGIVKNLYILNNEDFDALQSDCARTLKEGNNLIIFPEGTRTPRNATNPYKKGAARIALAAKANVQPIHIGGNDKYGLGKHDSFFKSNHTEKYFYDFKVLPQISMEKYESLPDSIAAKHLTDDMRAVIDSVK